MSGFADLLLIALGIVGWEDWMAYRIPANAEGNTVVDPTLLDGLSYPLSLGWTMMQLKLREVSAVHKQTPLTIVAIGAAERSEERLLRQTNYWAELGTLVPASRIDLHLVGPEISTAAAAAGPMPQNTPAVGGSPMIGHCFRGTLREFMAARPDLFTAERQAHGIRGAGLLPARTVIAGFNTGCGSGVAKLMESWSLDLGAQLIEPQHFVRLHDS